MKNWSEESSAPAPEAGTPVAAEQAPVADKLGAPSRVEIYDQYDHSEPVIKAFTEAIHLDYYADLDAIAISFTSCSVRNSSDVPEVFQTINQKLEQLLAEQDWHQRALLLDIAGLQVAAEAQLSWELVLDGFVSQSCPEVVPNRVLAVQYDSSRPPETRPADDNTMNAAPQESLHRAGNAVRRPALLAVAQTFDEAIDMVRRMRAGM
jgi:hypothetical protein